MRVQLTEAGRELRGQALHIPRCILDAAGLEFKRARHLLEEIGALRKALESYTA